MNARKVAACFTGVLSLIMLAEAWLLAAGVGPVSVTLLNATGGLPKCNMSDAVSHKCEQYPGSGATCPGGMYTTFEKNPGQRADYLVSTTLTDVKCTDDGCKNVTLPKYLGSEENGDCEGVSDPGGGGV